jgi:anti-sigma factor ChrR (cupin superfamily)
LKFRQLEPSTIITVPTVLSTNRRATMRLKITIAITFVFIFTSAAFVLAQATAEKTMAAAPVFIPGADMKWTDLDPTGAPGVKVADLWGDHKTGKFGAIFKLPAGFSVPLHTHTYEMKVVFISGTYIQAPEGKPEVRLGPGSYMDQPGGNYRHTTSCDPASDCVFFVESDGPFDLKAVGTEKASSTK